MPVTVIITLTASLVVAYVVNPVFAVWFMGDPKREGKVTDPRKQKRRRIFGYSLLILTTLSFYMSGSIGMGNFVITCVLFGVLYKYFISKGVKWFQQKGWPSIQNRYAGFLTWALRHPWKMIIGIVFLLIGSVMITFMRQSNIVLFPKGHPNFIFVYLTLPVGTDVTVTDSLTGVLEDKVIETLGKDNPIVESVISNVALGASEDPTDRSSTSNKGKIGIAFVEFGRRNGVSTKDYLDVIRNATKGVIPGAEIVVDQEHGGPPTPKPISVEIRGEDFDDLIATSRLVKRHLDSLAIPGVEELKSDLIVSKPEIEIDIDRERANREGISTLQIGSEFRTAILGKEATKFRDGEDEIPVIVRLQEDQRQNINAVENLNITFRDMNTGLLRSVPMASLADVRYTNTFGGIRRKDQERMITISSNITADAEPTVVVNAVRAAVAQVHAPDDIFVGFAGEDAEMLDAFNFLGRSLIISIFLILIILVTQFNSFGKTIIIMTEVLFAIIGVLLGTALTGMDFSVIMMGVGVVALAGIVVRNGILLVEFTDKLRGDGLEVMPALIEAGRIRMTPVLLTAFAAMLGLLPLAVGFNIDFATLFAEGDPNIYFGGDSVAFWGPLSWTIIFGLGFATFITLVILPIMYLAGWRSKRWWASKM
jgi:multidrug efflux pump subunit AcrB